MFLSTSFSFSQNEKLTAKQVRALLEKADEFLFKSRHQESLQLANTALKQSLLLKDNNLISIAYNCIAVNLEEIKEVDRAIIFNKKAFDYATLAQNDTLKFWALNNLGNIYSYEKKEYKKGISLYNQSIQYIEKLKDTASIVLSKMNIAEAYFKSNKPAEANYYLIYADTHYDKIKYDIDLVFYYMLKGIQSSHNKEPEKANFYFNKSIAIGLKSNSKRQLLDTYKEYANHLYTFKDYKNAYLNNSLHEQLQDEIFNEEKLKSAQLESARIQGEEYKRKINLVENENKLNQKYLRYSKLVQVLFVAIFIILLLLMFSIYKNAKLREAKNQELSKANEELKIAKDKAEEGSRLKSQFVSTITHELRTPLYGVIGITNIILDEHKELANSPHLKSLKFSAKYLLSLVNDILQINKIEEKRIVLENLIFNLFDEITTIKNSVEYIADKNNNKLIVEIDTSIPEFLIGDKLRLSQIIMNLVSNALKFTKNGEVYILADLKNIEGNTYYIEFKIIDNGVGIAKEDQEKVFDKFVQIERKEDDYQGTGLGLSIVSQLIELFGSKIHLESEENVGSKFTFTIGFEHNEQKSREIINNIEVDLSNNHLYNLLVVEDNKINQVVTKKIIANSNMSCTIVDDGFAALVALERETFDLILMDINMPLINGFDTTRKIREKGITTPVIALTAFDKQEVTEEAISAGMNDIMVKPFEPSKLFQVIKNQVNKKELTV